MNTFCFRSSNYDQKYGNKDWLYINNCGHYFNIHRDIITNRLIPRADYHILYVSNGEVRVNGIVLKKGESFLILPQEPHKYIYKKGENSNYYWIHFTGNKVEQILKKFDIKQGFNGDNKRIREKEMLLCMLIEELSKCSDEASDYAVVLLFSFLSLFKDGQKRKIFYKKAVKELENMRTDTSVSEIAKLYNVSTSHFIRSFKNIYRVTPNEYRQNYRISQARSLLTMTNLPIQDIAYQCGFSDPFYFSRLFKKKVGKSPYQYRNQESL